MYGETTTTIDRHWNEYDVAVAKLQLDNYGCIYLDEWGCPIDNDFEIAVLIGEDE